MTLTPDTPPAKAPAILVVGGAGYIGTHMVAALLDAGYAPVVLDDLSTGHRELVPGGTFVQGSCGDAALLDRVFAAHDIHAVMHFAARSLVGESVAKPLAYYRNNFCCTVQLIESMLQHGVERFIFSSTAAVYGEPEQIPITEDHRSDPSNPYGASKAAVERMLADTARAQRLRFTSLRYFNAAGAHPVRAIGERHDPETHLIPLVLQTALRERDRIEVFGADWPTADGTCIRDYVHVCDLADAHLLALRALTAGEPGGIYNLGTGNGFSVRRVLDAARKVTGIDIPVVESGRRPGDPAVLVASSDRIRAALGWSPRFPEVEAIVSSAWKWHQAEAVRRNRGKGGAA